MSLLSLLGWSTRRQECCEEAHAALRYSAVIEASLRKELAKDRTRHFAEVFTLERQVGALSATNVRLAHQTDQAEFARECARETAVRLAGQVTRLEDMLAVHGVQVPAVDHGEPT